MPKQFTNHLHTTSKSVKISPKIRPTPLVLVKVMVRRGIKSKTKTQREREPLKPSSAAVVSALIRQMSAETIIPKVWSLSAETYSELSAEILLTLTFLC